MLYYKVSQPVPGKGDAWVFYECDPRFDIVRQMTHIPGTGETDCFANPLVKKMTNMAFMLPSSKEEFESHWSDDCIRDTKEGDEGLEPRGVAGKSYFSLDMSIGEAMAVHPRVAEVFAAFHLGGCSHCGINQYETIGQVTAGYGVDSEMLIEVLEGLMQPREAGKSTGS